MLPQNLNLSALFNRVNMMRPERLLQIADSLSALATSGIKVAEGEPERGLLWLAGARSRQQKSVAVMGLYGMIDKRGSAMMDWMGGTSTDAFGAMFDQLVSDPNIKGIVIDTDSPGGTATGTYELSKKIYDAREAKPIVAVSNSEMNSAAYYIASAASKVFVTPSSQTGSIGVWSAAMEYSKAMEQDGVKVHVWRSEGSPYKAAFLPWQEFSKDSIQHEQEEVDRIYGEFRSSVARNRGVSEAVAQKSFGEGRVMHAKAAIAARLADRMATLEEVVGRIDSGKLTVSNMASQESLEAAFAEPLTPDESWRDVNATEAARLRLRRQGVL